MEPCLEPRDEDDDEEDFLIEVDDDEEEEDDEDPVAVFVLDDEEDCLEDPEADARRFGSGLPQMFLVYLAGHSYSPLHRQTQRYLKQSSSYLNLE